MQRAEAKGLASHSPERPRRYIPTQPELAVDLLIQQQRALIENARHAIPKLQLLASNAEERADEPDFVEVITNGSTLLRILQHHQQNIQAEVSSFQRAPVIYPDGNQKIVPKHLRIRSISDASYISLPGRLDLLRRLEEQGEEARYAHTLPMKMIIWDRRTALVPLSVENQEGPALLVRGSSLVAALCALFDLMWEQSTPIAFALSGKAPQIKNHPRLSQAAEAVIPLLAAGLNDKVITHQGDLSKTTLNRRIAELMQAFDARTRFQLGWRAALAAFPERAGQGEKGSVK